jgi:YidC/Oxa1 family membrane protein insertase
MRTPRSRPTVRADSFSLRSGSSDASRGARAASIPFRRGHWERSMAADGGQEQRAFWAIFLAMAVLLAWNVLFPPPKAPSPRSADPGAHPSDAPATLGEPPTTTEAARPPDAAGSLLEIAGAESLLRQRDAPAERAQVRVEGADLSVTIDGRGARLTEAVLSRYLEGADRPVQLLPEDGLGALGSVLVVNGRELPLDQFQFALVADEETQEGRRIAWELALDVVTLRKTFTVPREGHLIQVEHELRDDRAGLTAWGLSWAGGMRHTEETAGRAGTGYFHGIVLAEGKVQRKEPNQFRNGPGTWGGLAYFVTVQNKYFVGAIVPRGDSQGPAKLWRVSGGRDELPSVGGEILVERAAGLASNHVGYDVYIGPLDYARLSALGLGIEGAVDLGAKWVRPLSRAILAILIWMHGLIPNYGIVIVLFSSAINLAFFPLTFKSARSMRDMAALKPRLDALKEKHKNEPQKMSEATMRLYKEAGVNPLAGCFPLLLQMPIFFALYAVLFHTIELRQAPFVLWIRDLSQPDVVFHLPFSLPFVGSGIALLPIIMGVTSYFQSKATMVDPNQKLMVTLMPIMMTFIFFTMPSGLVLYWLTSNLFTIGQKFLMKPSAVAAAVAEEIPEGNGKTARKRRPKAAAGAETR